MAKPTVITGTDEIGVRRARSGFTLVELLVVIAIIGVLVALLLPAVQSAREAARRIQCKNHLKQLALGFVVHHDQQQHFPTGGWGYQWMSWPGAGFGLDQPGGWGYNVLPFIEQQPLHDLGQNEDDAGKRRINAQLHATPVAGYHCPTRRAAISRPVTVQISFVQQPLMSDRVTGGARNDYAVNAGVRITNGFGPGPASFAAAANHNWPPAQDMTGIIANRSQIRIEDVTDGTTNTYCVGEKYLSSMYYEKDEAQANCPSGNPDSLGDDQSVYSGDERDVVRYTNTPVPVSQDRPICQPEEDSYTWGFGSAHSSGFNMAMCDGSVRTVSYNVEQETHDRLGNREDGLPVDFNRL